MIGSLLSGSFRTGVILKYILEFPDAHLKVSNDLFAGDAVIDADITVTMSRLTAGATFEISLYDLPEKQAQLLADQIGPKKYPRVLITLGYLDTSTSLVTEGIYESIEMSVDTDRLVAKIKGKESAFAVLSKAEFTGHLSGKFTYGEALSQVLKLAKIPDKSAPNGLDLPGGALDLTPRLGTLPSVTLHNPRFASRKLLGIIDELARRANVEFLLLDKRVYFGEPVLNDDYAPAAFDRGVNLAKFVPFVKDIPANTDLNLPDPVPAKKMQGFVFVTIGDPKMRPAQKVVSKVKNYDEPSSPEFRIRQLKHVYSSTKGYTCEGVAARRDTEAGRAREIDNSVDRSAAAAAAGINKQIQQYAVDHPELEVTSVKAYHADQHRVDMYYGQPAAGEETQPSINVAVQQLAAQVFEGKPVVAPFAWRKCGLVTPVYPGMKAVVGHNRAMSSDGMVMGFVWSHDPDYAPPSNHDGDWWLCLPIDFDATQPPQDATKAVNDLTANDGRRVIELKGLKITVGAAALKGIGERPTPGDEETCSIEHASGAKITVKNGEIDVTDGSSSPATITLKNGEITLSAGGEGGPQLSLKNSEISLTDGIVTLRLSGGQASFA